MFPKLGVVDFKCHSTFIADAHCRIPRMYSAEGLARDRVTVSSVKYSEGAGGGEGGGEGEEEGEGEGDDRQRSGKMVSSAVDHWSSTNGIPLLSEFLAAGAEDVELYVAAGRRRLSYDRMGMAIKTPRQPPPRPLPSNHLPADLILPRANGVCSLEIRYHGSNCCKVR